MALDINNLNMVSFLQSAFPTIKAIAIIVLGILITVIGVIVILEMKKRKWKIEVHELKADGKLHTVGRDILVEKKLNMGSKTVYWLKKAKQEAIPPPDECVDRFKGKEEVDYLRVARDYIPTTKSTPVNYNDPVINKKLLSVHDRIIQNIRETKTTLFNSEPVRNRFVYIPINKTLTASLVFKPIDYDVSMMAMNEIHNADEFYSSKYEFWKKYGAIIVFAMTIIFLIILAVLTFGYLKDIVTAVNANSQQTAGMFQQLIDKLGGAKPPS